MIWGVAEDPPFKLALRGGSGAQGGAEKGDGMPKCFGNSAPLLDYIALPVGDSGAPFLTKPYVKSFKTFRVEFLFNWRIKMKKIKFTLLGVFIFLLFCCGGTLKVITYVSDLIQVADDADGLMFVTANIMVENLNDPTDIDFLRENLNSFSNEEIIKNAYADSLSFDIKVPLINEEKISSYDFERDLLYIIASEKNDSYIFKYKFNADLTAIIDEYIYEMHYQHLTIEDFEVSIIIDNDMQAPATITAYSVYINGRPYPLNYTGEIQRRDRLELQVSEVLRAAIAKNNRNTYDLFKIDK
jgi:hypothetical protein